MRGEHGDLYIERSPDTVSAGEDGMAMEWHEGAGNTKGGIGRVSMVVLALTLVMSSVMWTCGRVYSHRGAYSPPQIDSLMYFQYAKAIADGHPYRYRIDDAPSTGSTSHLYPMVLAIPHALGARGTALFVVSFLLCAGAYGATLAAVARLAKRLCPDAALAAVLLGGLNGQVVTTLFGHSDMVLYTPLILWTLVSGLERRRMAATVLIVLCAFSRPEGMVFSALLFAAGVVASIVPSWRDAGGRAWKIGAVGLVASLGVLALNQALTGSCSFGSLALKGHFAIYPFVGAVQRTVLDFGTLLRELFWGFSADRRALYVMPLIGGGLFLAGLAPRRSGAAVVLWESVTLLSMAASLVLVAASGFQGFMFDRYLGWCAPILCVYVAIGLTDACRRLESRLLAWTLVLLVAGGVTAGLAGSCAALARESLDNSSRLAFVEQVGQALPDGAEIGLDRYIGAAYLLPRQGVRSLSGIASPRFALRRSFAESFETLKHEPDLRFGYWLLTPEQTNTAWYAPLVGRQVGQEISSVPFDRSLTLYESDWTMLNVPDGPVQPASRAAVEGLERTDHLDVGYGRDERDHDRQVGSRLPGMNLIPFVQPFASAAGPMMEVGDLVLGWESFDVATQPGRGLRIVMRTAAGIGAHFTDSAGDFTARTFALESPLRLNVAVDGRLVEPVEAPLVGADGNIDEVVFDIAGHHITRDQTRLTLYGDHIAMAFWFYSR